MSFLECKTCSKRNTTKLAWEPDEFAKPVMFHLLWQIGLASVPSEQNPTSLGSGLVIHNCFLKKIWDEFYTTNDRGRRSVLTKPKANYQTRQFFSNVYRNTL